jgi:hypothetical protein
MAILLGLGARLFLAYHFRGNYDQFSYEIVVNILERGENVYSETSRYNYTLLWAFVPYWLKITSDIINLPFHFVIRGFLSSIDLIDSIFIGLIARRAASGRSTIAFSSIYLLNPVAILIVGIHGQFDNLAMLPLLAATYLGQRQQNRSGAMTIWFLGTLSLLIKQTALFGVWMLFVYATKNHRRALIMILLAVIVFLSTFLVDIQQTRTAVLENVLMYYAKPNQYGVGKLLPPYLSVPMFFGLLISIPFIARHYLNLSLPRAMTLAFVVWITSTYGIAEQYFILPIIWGSIFPGTWYWIFTATATVFLMGSPNNLDIPHIPAIWNTVWFAAGGWFLSTGLHKLIPN